MFRQKDIWNFWSQPHYERVGGVELASPTAWVPQAQADLAHRDRLSGGRQGRQPAERVSRSEVVGSGAAVFFHRHARRSDPAPLSRSRARRLRSGLRRRDAQSGLVGLWRPHGRARRASICGPGTRGLIRRFPPATDVWSDGANWETGHWLTGRLGSTPLDGLVGDHPRRQRRERRATPATLGEGPDGYVVDRPMAPRAMLDPLALAFAFDAVEQDGVLRFRQRGGAPVARARRGRSGAAGRRRAGAADAHAGKRSAARGHASASPISAPTISARRRPRAGWSAARRARAHADLADGDQRQRRPSGARKSGCRICGPGARAPNFALPPSRLALTPGDVVGADRQRPAAADRDAGDQPTPKAAPSRARSIDPDVFDAARWRRRAGARRVPPPAIGAGACAGARSADA